MLKFDHVSIWVGDEESVDAEPFETMRRPCNVYPLVDQPSVPGIDIAGNNRNHAASRLDDAIGEYPANTDAGIFPGCENARVTLVPGALEAQHIGVERGAHIEVFGIEPADMRDDVGITIFQVTPLSVLKM